jgi:hypothetical protein
MAAIRGEPDGREIRSNKPKSWPTVAFSCARNEMVRRMLATDCHRPLLLERRLMPGFEKEIEPREPEGPQDSIPTLTAGLSLCPSSS